MNIKPPLFLTTVLCFVSVAYGQESASLTPLESITLPNVQGGLNHMSVDPERERLFVSAPTNRSLEVLDVSSGRRTSRSRWMKRIIGCLWVRASPHSY